MGRVCIDESELVMAGLAEIQVYYSVYNTFINVLNCNQSVQIHFTSVIVFIESSNELCSIRLNNNVMTLETVNKRKISLCIATKLIRPNKSKEF